MATYVLTIAGVTKDLNISSLQLRETLNGRHTLQCSILSEDGSYRPAMGAEVILTENATRIYGGLIDQPSEAGHGGMPGVPISTTISAADFRAYADRRYVNETVPAGTLKAALQVLDDYLTEYGVALDGAQVNGPNVEEQFFDYVLLTDVLDRYSAMTGYVWEIDYNKVLRMFAPGTVSAPFNIAANDDHVVGDMTVEPSRLKYANRVIAKVGSQGFITKTDTFTGDGITDTFTLTHQIDGHFPGSNPTANVVGYSFVYVDGVGEPVGTIAANVIWLYDHANKTIERQPGPPSNGAAISIMYDVQYPITVIAENAGEIAANGTHEEVISIKDPLDLDAAQALVDGMLTRREDDPQIVKYGSDELGIHPGQTQSIVIPIRNVNGTFLITDVETSDIQARDADGSALLHRTVTATGGTTYRGSSPRDQYKAWLGTGGGGSAAPISTGVTPPSPPIRSAQFNADGAFGGTADVLIDDDGDGDTYGVDDLPARVAVGADTIDELVSVFEDDFESATALSSDYDTVINMVKTAGVGNGGTQGIEGSGTNSQKYFAELRKTATTNSRRGRVSFDVKPLASIHQGVGHYHLEVAPTSAAAAAFGLYSGGSYPATAFGDLTLYRPSGVEIATVQDVFTDNVYATILVEFELSSVVAGVRQPDAWVKVYIDGVLEIDEDGLTLGVLTSNPNNYWGGVRVSPQGAGDNLILEVPTQELEQVAIFNREAGLGDALTLSSDHVGDGHIRAAERVQLYGGAGIDFRVPDVLADLIRSHGLHSMLGVKWGIVNVTANHTVDTTLTYPITIFRCVPTVGTGVLTVTLPPLAAVGAAHLGSESRVLVFVNGSGGTRDVILDADGSETIRWGPGSATTTIRVRPGSAVILVPVLAINWQVVASHGLEDVARRATGVSVISGDFSWVNQGSSTIRDDGDSAVLTGAATGSGAANLVLRVKTAPSAPYVITARLLPCLINKQFQSYGICFRENGTGEIHVCDILMNGAGSTLLRSSKYTSATAFSADYVTYDIPRPLEWFRIADNNTDRICSVSADGVDWLQFHSVGRTDFLTADRVGFFVSTENAATPNFAPILRVTSWEQT